MSINPEDLFDLATQLGRAADNPGQVRKIASELFDLGLGAKPAHVSEEPERTGDREAPYGYDDEGNPLAPYGFRRDGRPALKRGRTKRGGMALISA